MFQTSKHYLSVEDFTFDLSSVSVSSVRISGPPALTIVDMGAQLPSFVMRIRGGLAYEVYDIDLLVTLTSGDVRRVQVKLRNTAEVLHVDWLSGVETYLLIDWSSQLSPGVVLIGASWSGDSSLTATEESFGNTWSKTRFSQVTRGARLTARAVLSSGETLVVDVVFT